MISVALSRFVLGMDSRLPWRSGFARRPGRRPKLLQAILSNEGSNQVIPHRHIQKSPARRLGLINVALSRFVLGMDSRLPWRSGFARRPGRRPKLLQAILSNEGSNQIIPHRHIQKSPARRLGFFVYGGEGGIRTLGALRHTHFPGVLLRPLGHLTVLFSETTCAPEGGTLYTNPM